MTLCSRTCNILCEKVQLLLRFVTLFLSANTHSRRLQLMSLMDKLARWFTCPSCFFTILCSPPPTSAPRALAYLVGWAYHAFQVRFYAALVIHWRKTGGGRNGDGKASGSCSKNHEENITIGGGWLVGRKEPGAGVALEVFTPRLLLDFEYYGVSLKSFHISRFHCWSSMVLLVADTRRRFFFSVWWRAPCSVGGCVTFEASKHCLFIFLGFLGRGLLRIRGLAVLPPQQERVNDHN